VVPLKTITLALERNLRIIKLQTTGMSQEECLIQLPFRCNCMNWLVGHILVNRLNILKLLNSEFILLPEALARYQTESEPITVEGPGVLPIDELIAYLTQSQDQLAKVLSSLDPAELERSVAFFGGRSQVVGEWLFFFYFHDTYHVGQTEILRQAAGKDDKII
jgi:hypothetical protein